MVTTVVVENRPSPDDGARRRERNAPSRRSDSQSSKATPVAPANPEVLAAAPKAQEADPSNGKSDARINGKSNGKSNGKANGKNHGTFPEPAPIELSDSERYEQISRCAYYRAEGRGFAPGYMWDDWLAAEREVTARLALSSHRKSGDPKI